MRWMCWWATFWMAASAHASGLVPLEPTDPAETASAEARTSPANTTDLPGGEVAASPDDVSTPIASNASQVGETLPDLPPNNLDFAADGVALDEELPAEESLEMEDNSIAPVYADPNEQMLADSVEYFSSPPGRQWYGRMDWLYWEATDPKPNGVVFRAESTSVTSPNFQSLIRLDDPNTDHEMGLRFWVGRKFADEFGIEFGGLWVYPTNFIEQYNSGFTPGSSFSSATLDSVFYAPTNELVAFGNQSFRTRYWGLETNGRWMLVDGRTWSFDAIAGVRYLNYSERLAFEYEFANLVDITERFDTGNNNIGGQLGGDFTAMLFEYMAFFTHARAGLLGNIQDVDVTGPSPGQGRLTNASNLGTHDNSELSVLLEFNVGLEWFWTPDISFLAGYSGIWLSEQMRSADQVDLANSVPGGNPVVSLRSDDIWLHGFMAALKAKW